MQAIVSSKENKMPIWRRQYGCVAWRAENSNWLDQISLNNSKSQLFANFGWKVDKHFVKRVVGHTNINLYIFDMPTKLAKFARYYLAQWISKLPEICEIHWLRQCLLNVFLFGTKDL